VLIIIENGLGFLANFVSGLLGPDKGAAYVESVSTLTLLIVIASVAVFSTFLTLLCEITD
jgi:ABC-type phosphate/phosphonate transport system permease subunit